MANNYNPNDLKWVIDPTQLQKYILPEDNQGNLNDVLNQMGEAFGGKESNAQKDIGTLEKIANSVSGKALKIFMATTAGLYMWAHGGDFVDEAQYNTENVGEAFAGQKTLPADKYNPKGSEVSEANFRKTINNDSAKGKFVWVMYEAKNIDKEYQDRGEKVWKRLKEEFKDQVTAYLRIDVTDWQNRSQTSTNEIGKSVYPSFILYCDSEIVREEKGNGFVRLRGPPSGDRLDVAIQYIKEQSPLK